MSNSELILPALAVIMATSVVTWLWLAFAGVARTLQGIRGFEGMHLEP